MDVVEDIRASDYDLRVIEMNSISHHTLAEACLLPCLLFVTFSARPVSLPFATKRETTSSIFRFFLFQHITSIPILLSSTSHIYINNK